MKSLKILIVNDSPSMTAVIRAIVERQPELTVVGAVSNGVEAITSASVLMPDLVLMDIHMPVMGGIEATRRIMASHPSTRILITTATVNRNLKLIFDALQHGALDYVHSP